MDRRNQAGQIALDLQHATDPRAIRVLMPVADEDVVRLSSTLPATDRCCFHTVLTAADGQQYRQHKAPLLRWSWP
jgi:hypothetical protein